MFDLRTGELRLVLRLAPLEIVRDAAVNDLVPLLQVVLVRASLSHSCSFTCYRTVFSGGRELVEASGVDEPIQRGEREDLAARGHDQIPHVLTAHTEAPSIDAGHDLE